MEKRNRVEELFFAALEQESSHRELFLADACAGDLSLKEEVEALLKARDEAFDLPDKPAWALFAEEPQETPDVEAGLPFEHLGEFRLIRCLGEGGMGVIYLAEQGSLNRRVALKVIRAERMGSFEAETRFWREAEALSKLNHPHMVTIYGKGKDQGVNFIAMEYIPGQGLEVLLREALADDRSLPRSEVLRWIHGVARALGAGHRAGIIHRDVKPSNIRITPEGKAKLLDFGIARQDALATLTLTGEFRGTPHYASPEQVKAGRQAIDFRTDIYSLGVTLYEAVTGRVPFDGETTEQVFHQILEQEPKPPRRLDPTISRDLETVIVTAMEKDRENRYRTMDAFADDIDRVLEGRTPSAKPVGWVRRASRWAGRHRYAASAAGLIVFLSALLIFVSLEFSRKKANELKIAKERFKPLREALLIYDSGRLMIPWIWCFELDKNAPDGLMMKALSHIETDRWEEARNDLAACLKQYEQMQEESLADDAQYLLGIVDSALAKGGEVAPRQGKSFKPLSPETLVWRETEDEQTLKELKINSEHRVVHLSWALAIFADLFMGGEIEDYQKAIKHFETVLKSRPENLTALIFLGRTYYFFARSCNFLDLLDDGRAYLEKALALSGDRPSFWIFTTLGSIALLEGKNDQALRYNEQALKATQGSNSDHIHNVRSGLGKVCARQGRSAEALKHYRAALEKFPTDTQVRIAMAEIYLLQGNIDKAMENIDILIRSNKRVRAFGKNELLQSSAYLACVRILLAKKDYVEAERVLIELFNKAILSLHDFSLATLLITTFPEEKLRAEESDADLPILAEQLIYTSWQCVKNQDRIPPIVYSGIGAMRHLRGDYRVAITYFEQAIAERAKFWPVEILRYYWTEDARDLYLLSMTFSRLSHETDPGQESLDQAKNFFNKAEALFAERTIPIEAVDRIKRFRSKAIDLLANGSDLPSNKK